MWKAKKHKRKESDSITFDQHHHAPRLLQLAHHLLQRVGAYDFGVLRFVVQKVVHLLGGSIVGADHEAVVVHVQNQVLAHHGETDQRDIGTVWSDSEVVVRFPRWSKCLIAPVDDHFGDRRFVEGETNLD